MKTLILAAGKGVRLRPLTNYIPKPMVPLRGKPLLEWELLHLMSCGFNDFVIAVSYLAEQIINYFEDGKRWNVKIEYSYGKQPAGKAGEVLQAYDFLQDEPYFLIVPGDTISHIDYRELLNFHLQKRGMATVAFSTRYNLEVGWAEIDYTNMIVKFHEKPNINKPVSSGIYLLNRDIFYFINKIKEQGKDIIDLPEDVFPLLLQENIPIYGFVENYNWWDVGRLYDYEKLSRMRPEEISKILPWNYEAIIHLSEGREESPSNLLSHHSTTFYPNRNHLNY